jgi:hypothetical protein
VRAALKFRVQINSDDWTPIPNRVFEDLLATLKERHSAFVFFHLYDLAYHRPSKGIATTVGRLASEAGLDRRTIEKSLKELEQRELIRQIREGVKHSKNSTRQPIWEVPLANLDRRDGNWTPIPRNIIRDYCREYPNSALLPLLIYFQNMQKLDYSWPGARKLGLRMNWSVTRVRNSLRCMFDEKVWRARHPELPRPLDRATVPYKGKRSRRYSVRAIQYDRRGEKVVMKLSREFRMAFDIV